MGYLEEQQRAHEIIAEENAKADALDVQRCPYPSYKDPCAIRTISRIAHRLNPAAPDSHPPQRHLIPLGKVA